MRPPGHQSKQERKSFRKGAEGYAGPAGHSYVDALLLDDAISALEAELDNLAQAIKDPKKAKERRQNQIYFRQLRADLLILRKARTEEELIEFFVQRDPLLRLFRGSVAKKLLATLAPELKDKLDAYEAYVRRMVKEHIGIRKDASKTTRTPEEIEAIDLLKHILIDFLGFRRPLGAKASKRGASVSAEYDAFVDAYTKPSTLHGVAPKLHEDVMRVIGASAGFIAQAETFGSKAANAVDQALDWLGWHSKYERDAQTIEVGTKLNLMHFYPVFTSFDFAKDNAKSERRKRHKRFVSSNPLRMNSARLLNWLGKRKAAQTTEAAPKVQRANSYATEATDIDEPVAGSKKESQSSGFFAKSIAHLLKGGLVPAHQRFMDFSAYWLGGDRVQSPSKLYFGGEYFFNYLYTFITGPIYGVLTAAGTALSTALSVVVTFFAGVAAVGAKLYGLAMGQKTNKAVLDFARAAADATRAQGTLFLQSIYTGIKNLLIDVWRPLNPFVIYRAWQLLNGIQYKLVSTKKRKVEIDKSNIIYTIPDICGDRLCNLYRELLEAGHAYKFPAWVLLHNYVEAAAKAYEDKVPKTDCLFVCPQLFALQEGLREELKSSETSKTKDDLLIRNICQQIADVAGVARETWQQVPPKPIVIFAHFKDVIEINPPITIPIQPIHLTRRIADFNETLGKHPRLIVKAPKSSSILFTKPTDSWEIFDPEKKPKQSLATMRLLQDGSIRLELTCQDEDRARVIKLFVKLMDMVRHNKAGMEIAAQVELDLIGAAPNQHELLASVTDQIASVGLKDHVVIKQPETPLGMTRVVASARSGLSQT